jgi:hypothetical protein
MLSKALIGPTKINAAIEDAARRYGVSPDAMRVIAQIESGGNPYAKNPKSSAGGLFQFIDSTAKQYGLTNKFDAGAASDAGARLLRDNAASLRGVLGREPTVGELYLAHQQGAGGARKLLSNPNARAVDIVGADAVRLNGGRLDMTAGEFAQIWTRKANKIAGSEEPVSFTASAGDETLAGGEDEDAIIADLRKMIVMPDQVALPSPEDAYAATGALDVSDDMIIADLRKMIIMPPAPDDQAPGDSGAMRGLGLGARSVAEGLASTVGAAYDPIAATMNAAFGTSVRPLVDQVSQGLTGLGLPSPQTGQERVMSAIQSGAAGSIGGVGAGRAIGGAVGGALASGPVSQVMGGAGAGAGAQMAAEGGAGMAGQIGAGLAGAVLGAAPASIGRPVISAQDARTVAQAERAGISPMTSDVIQPQTFVGRSIQRIGELVPLVGTGPVRAAQQAARVQAVRDLARVFGADGQASDDVMKALLAKRGADLEKYSVLKNDVITSVPGQVDVTSTVKAIDDQVASLRGLKTAEVQPVIAKLEDWKRAIQGQDLGNIELLRKQIGEAFEAPDLAAVRSSGKKALSAIYGPLRSDMGDHIKANGQPRDFTKWSVANKRLSEMMGELDNASLKSALAKGDVTPERVRALLFSSKPSDVKTLYKNLPPEGRARARAAVLQEAITKASDGDSLSPQKFRSQLVKLGSPVGVFFSGQDLQAVDGMRRVLDMTQRAGESAAFGPTGVQTLPVVGGMALTDLAGGLGSGMLAGGAMGAAARGFESKAVRNLLLAISKTEAGSKEEAAILKRIMEASRAEKTTQEGQQ